MSTANYADKRMSTANYADKRIIRSPNSGVQTLVWQKSEMRALLLAYIIYGYLDDLV
jgi:hypothetical protein